jgi:hypothetical protein
MPPKPTPQTPTSTPHNPFAPAIAAIESNVVLPVERFLRAAVGATESEVAKIKAWFDALPEADKQGYLDRLVGLSSADLKAEVAARVPGAPPGTPVEAPEVESGTESPKDPSAAPEADQEGQTPPATE